MITIKDLFNQVIKSSTKARSSKKNFDGQVYWQPIKKILANSKWTAKKWKKSSDTYYKKIMLLPEIHIDGYGNQTTNEVNHFIIQTVRIPRTEKPSLRKLIQLALNIGQYKAETNKNTKYYKLEHFVDKKLGKIKLEDIMDIKDIKKLDKYLK